MEQVRGVAHLRAILRTVQGAHIHDSAEAELDALVMSHERLSGSLRRLLSSPGLNHYVSMDAVQAAYAALAAAGGV